MIHKVAVGEVQFGYIVTIPREGGFGFLDFVGFGEGRIRDFTSQVVAKSCIEKFWKVTKYSRCNNLFLWKLSPELVYVI